MPDQRSKVKAAVKTRHTHKALGTAEAGFSPHQPICKINMSLAGTIARRTFATSTARNAIKHVTIIGGGLMGSGIAQVGVVSVNLLSTASDQSAV